MTEEAPPMTPEQRAAWDVQHIIDQENRERQSTLDLTDMRMPRVIEDILDILVAKKVVAESELPQAVRDLIAKRRDTRTAIQTAAKKVKPATS